MCPSSFFLPRFQICCYFSSLFTILCFIMLNNVLKMIASMRDPLKSNWSFIMDAIITYLPSYHPLCNTTMIVLFRNSSEQHTSQNKKSNACTEASNRSILQKSIFSSAMKSYDQWIEKKKCSYFRNFHSTDVWKRLEWQKLNFRGNCTRIRKKIFRGKCI